MGNVRGGRINQELGILVVQTIKESACSQGFLTDFWVRKIPWRREWLPTPVFLPEEFCGQRLQSGGVIKSWIQLSN